MNNILTDEEIKFPITLYFIQHEPVSEIITVGEHESTVDIGYYIVKPQKINNTLQLLQLSTQIPGFIERINTQDIYTTSELAITVCNELNVNALANIQAIRMQESQ